VLALTQQELASMHKIQQRFIRGTVRRVISGVRISLFVAERVWVKRVFKFKVTTTALENERAIPANIDSGGYRNCATSAR
jgi:hypothetical protein